MNSITKYVSRIAQSAFFRDSLWAIVGSVCGKGLSLLASIIVARCLGNELYGEYGAIRNMLVYVAIVSTIGFGYSATKFIVEYIESKREKLISLVFNIEYITILISGCLMILVILSAGVLSEVLSTPALRFTLQMFSPLIVLNALSTTQIAILSGFKKFRAMVWINAVAGIVLFLFSLVLTPRYGLNGSLIALLLSFAVQVVISQILIRKALLDSERRERVTVGELVSMLNFSLPVALQESLYVVVHWLTLWILIHYANYGEVGLSSAASLWLAVVIFIPSVLKNVMFSYLSSVTNHHVMVKRMLQINFLTTFLPVLALVVGADLIVHFYGDAFGGLAGVIRVTLCSAIFISMAEVFCYEIIAVGKPWWAFSARFIRDTLILTLAFCIIRQVSDCQALWMSVCSLAGNALFLFLLAILYKKIYTSSQLVKSSSDGANL